MDDLLSDLRQNLRSDKANARKNGKKLFEELQSGKFNHGTVKLLGPKQTIYLIEAAATYQENEINSFRAKNKDPGIDCAIFFRSVVKYCIKNGQISPFHLVSIVDIVNMTIGVLTNQQLSVGFRNVYKSIICDLLDGNLSLIYPFKLEKTDGERGIQLWFTYLRDTLVDRKSCSDSHNIKLLKSLCASTFHDMGGEAGYCCLAIMDWLNDILQSFATGDNDESSLMIVSTITDCFSSFLRNRGLSILNGAIPKLTNIFSIIVRHLSNYQTRQVHVEAFYGFLDGITEILLFQASGLEDGIVGLHLLQDPISQLCKYFISEEFFTRVSNTWKLSSQGRRLSTKDSGAMLDDPVVMLAYGVSAKLWLIYRKIFLEETFSQSDSNSDEREMKRRRVEIKPQVTSGDLIGNIIIKLQSLDFSSERTSRNEIWRKKQEPLAVFFEGAMLSIQCFLTLLMKISMKTYPFNPKQFFHNAQETVDLFESVLLSVDEKSLIGSTIGVLSLFLLGMNQFNVDEDHDNTVKFSKNLFHVIVKVSPNQFKICKGEWYKLIFLVLRFGRLQQQDKEILCDVLSKWEMKKNLDFEGSHGLWCFLLFSEFSKTLSGASLVQEWVEVVCQQDSQRGFQIHSDYLKLQENRPLVMAILFGGMKMHLLENGIVGSKLRSEHSVNFLLEQITEYCRISLTNADFSTGNNILFNHFTSEVAPNLENGVKAFTSWERFKPLDPIYYGAEKFTSTWANADINTSSLQTTLKVLDIASQIWNYQLESDAVANSEFNDNHVQLLQLGILFGHIYCVCRKLALSAGDINQANIGNRQCLNSILKLLLAKGNSASVKMSESIIQSICYSIFLCQIPWHSDQTTSHCLQSLMNWHPSDGNDNLKRNSSKNTHIEDPYDFGTPFDEVHSLTEDHDGLLSFEDPGRSNRGVDLLPLRRSLIQLGSICKIWSPEEQRTTLKHLDERSKFQTGLALLELFALEKSSLPMKMVLDHFLDFSAVESFDWCCFYQTLKKVLNNASIWNLLNGSTEGEQVKELLVDRIFNVEELEDIFPVWICRFAKLECVIEVLKYSGEVESLKDKLPEIFLRSIEDSDFRVRRLAAENLSHLIRLFRNPSKVYDSLLAANPISLLVDNNSDALAEDPLDIKVLAMSIVEMCSANPNTLLRRGVLDLVKLYGCRQSQVKAMALEKIIFSSFTQLASEILYESAAHLLQFNFGWLFHLWQEYFFQHIDDGSATHDELSAAASRLFGSFPFQMLYMGYNHAADPGFVRKFVISKFRESLISIISLNRSSRVRWMELTALCRELDFPTHDGQVARLIQKSLCKIKSLQIILESFANTMDSQEKKEEMNEFAMYVDRFVSGIVNDTEINDVLAKRDFQFVLESLTIFYHPSRCQFYQLSSLSEVEKILSSMIERVCKMLKNLAVETLCTKINYLAVVAQMMYFIRTCGVEGITLNFFGVLIFIIRHTNILNQEIGVFYLIKLVNLIIRRFPSFSNEVVEIVKAISTSLMGNTKLNISVWRMIFAEWIILYFGWRGVHEDDDSVNWNAFVNGYFFEALPQNAALATSINTIIHELIANFESRHGRNMFRNKIIQLPSVCCVEFFESNFAIGFDIRNCFQILESYLNFEGTIAMIWLQLEFLKDLCISENMLSLSYEERCRLTELLINIKLHNRMAKLSRTIDDIISHQIILIISSVGSSMKVESNTIHRLLLPFRSTQYNTQNITILLIEMLFHGQFSDISPQYEACSHVLSRLSSQRFFEHSRELFMCHDFAGNAVQCIRVNYSSFLEPAKFDVFEHLQCGPLETSLIQRCNSEYVWNEELWDQKGRKYGDWLSALCFCMLQYLLDFVKRNDLTKNPGIERHRNLLMLMSVLAPACLVSVEISELVFPLLVFEIIHLCGAQSVATTTLSRHIFKYLLHENADIQCCKLGCDTLVFLLRQNIEDFKNGKELTQPSSEQQSQSTRVNGQYSYFLTIDYESAAAAAIRCKCTSIALLFAELYSQQSGATVIRALQMADTANQVSLKASEKLKSLLIPIYRSVNDVDMIEGLDFSTDLYLQAECYAAKNQWLQALSTYESILSAQHDIPIEVVSEGMGACLEGLGTKSFVQKSGAIGKYNNRVDSNKHNAEYDLSIWFDDQDPTFAGSAKLSEEFLAITARIENLNIRAEGFCALKVLCKKSISSALNAYIFEDMKTASMNLHMVSDFGKLVLCGNYGEEATVPISNKSILDSFSSQLSYHASNHAQLFNIRRPLAVLAALARAKRITSFEAMIPVKELCKWDADLSHKISPSLYGFWREMEVNVRSQSNQLDSVLLQGMIDIQKSLLLWGKGMSDASIHMISVVKDVVTRERGGLKKSSGRPADKSSQYVDRLYAEAMRTIGVWLSKRGSISPNDVLVKYLQPALSGCKDLNVLIESTYAVAQFSYEMFVNLDQKINSSEWKMGMKVLHHREIEFQQCSALKPADSTKAVISFNGINIDVREFMRHINMLKKEIDMDKKERNLVEVSLISFLKLALHHFGKVLQLQSKQSITESNDLKVDSQDVVFRLIGLWLSNSEKNEANETMGMILPSISSHFFVPLTYQILSRLGLNANAGSSPSNPLSSSNTSFEGVLKQLVFGICRDHPYHCLPQLFALINGTTSLNSQVVKGNISTDRKLAAEEIYHQLIAAGTDVSKIATCMEKFLQNYIELAVASTEIFHKSGKCKGIKFSDVQARGKRFHELLESYPIKPPILTKDISISIRGQDYATNGFITTIVEIPPDFSITENGISRPKIIICRGDDGRSYRQLVKSGDDMRQDAVMEQVFRTVNQILRRYESTRTRQLNIRTYNVIPTTNQTGLLEWVENTAPIGMLLVDKDKGLHNRYSLKDWKHHQCRDHLKNAVDNEDKEKRFNEICTNFHPVFKYFFLESFSHPFDWLHRRLAYIHSVAANSITGYILGIGDRHAFNILIDTITGEAVHIDFGIVFDQGKGLLTPETVPFRLTREIVDGMGITGCEGSFRRSCEEVMKVLRANASHMLTILEVIIHDPLYKWSLSPFEAQLKQSKQKEGGEVGGGKLQLAVASPTPTPRKSGSKESGGKASLQEKDRPQTPGVNASAPENASAADSTNFGKEAAERTLLRIRNKLRGFENPTGEALGVESHIDLLINEARNPFNLCKIFPGWAPWL